jgi:hypothetical protein
LLQTAGKPFSWASMFSQLRRCVSSMGKAYHPATLDSQL